MLIYIKQSIAEAVENNNIAVINDVLYDICLGQRKGRHFVYAERSTIWALKCNNRLDKYITDTFRMIDSRYFKLNPLYKMIKNTYCANVIYDNTTPTGRNLNGITINARDWETGLISSEDNFRFFEVESSLLLENLDDFGVYEYILNYYCRNVLRLNKKYYKINEEHGGGSATCQMYEKHSKKKDSFCLAVADSDIKYKGYSPLTKTTFQNIEAVDQELIPFNCKCYSIPVRDVENLIPISIIKDSKKDCKYWDVDKLLTNNSGYDIVVKYFDYKEGLKKIENDANEKQYWESQFPSIVHLKTIKGFGKNILEDVITTKNDDLKNASKKLLLDNNLERYWAEIGNIIFAYCCSIDYFR